MARYRVGLETRARILDATRALLGEVGYEGTTLKAITDRAGVGAGSFYNLFETKEAAILTVIREAIAAVDPDPDGAGRDTVADLVAAFVRFFRDDPALARIYATLTISRGLADPGLRERVQRHHARRVERFAGALQREFPALDAATAQREAESLVATLTGFAMRSLLDPGFDLEGYAAALAPETATTE